MISMKTNRDMDIYKRQFRSQEFARELNKREQRRLDQEVGGRGGIEAEYRFNLDKVNQERKEIEKELNKIRGGVHKQLGHHATLSSDKKFHHPKFKELGMKDVSSRSPRLQRKAPPENNSRGRDSSPMNAEMLIQYLQSFNEAHAQEHNDLLDGIKGSGRINQNKYNDHPHVQINPLIISDQPKPSEAENSNDFEEQKQYIQTLSDSQSQDVPSNEPTGTKEPSLQISRNESGEITTEMSSPRHSPVRRMSLDKGRHIVPGTSPPKHSAVRRLSLDKGKGSNEDIRGHPTSARKSPTEKGKFHHDDFHGHLTHPTSARRASIEKGKFNHDAVHGHLTHPTSARRFSLDKGRIHHDDARGYPTSARRSSMEKGSHHPPVLVNEEKIPYSPVEDPKTVIEIENAVKELEIESVETRKVPTEEEQQKPSKVAIGPESFNPDGSLKTMYTAPPFEQTWEEAKKARYIRTREPLERDRQLTTNEIFDKTS